MGKPGLGAGVALVAVAAAFALHEHDFVATFTVGVNGIPTSYRAPVVPAWRDPAAFLIAMTGIAAGIEISLGRFRSFGVALIVLGCAFASAVYVHQQDAYRHPCPPFVLGCPVVALPPAFWQDSGALAVAAAGVALAVGIVFYRRISTNIPSRRRRAP